MSQFFKPAMDENNDEQIMDHVRVHVESNGGKSKIPTKEKRQVDSYYQSQMPVPSYASHVEPASIDREYKPQIHVNIETEKRRDEIQHQRERRSLGEEYTKDIRIPESVENNLGVIHQKRVEEEVEDFSGKRNKILKLVKRQMYEPPYWEPRATIHGVKAMKNPILQLLRAAAGQKTQRILGLNSKSFDIFPGPLPDERNIALNNNYGKVTSEAPTGRYPQVDQQIMKTFRRPYVERAQQPQYFQQQEISPMKMYSQQQQGYSRHILQQPMDVAQQPGYSRQVLQQPMEVSQQQPQQEMRSMEEFPQRAFSRRFQGGFSNFASFSRRAAQQAPPVMQPQEATQMFPQQEVASMFPQQQQPDEMFQPRGEEIIQPPQPQMFTKPSSFYPPHPQMLEETAPQTRGLPQRLPMEQEQVQPRTMSQIQEPTPKEMAQFQEIASSPYSMPYDERPQRTPSFREAPQSYPMLEQGAEVPAMERSIAKPVVQQQEKVTALPELKYNDQIRKLLRPSAPMEAPRAPTTPSFTPSYTQPMARELPQISPALSNSMLYQALRDTQAPHEFTEQPLTRQLPEAPLFSPYMAARPRQMIAPRIPRPRPMDDYDEEKPEVHVHIQTEKSHISKPNEESTNSKKTNTKSKKS